MYDYNINVLKQQYNLNDQIDLTKPKQIVKSDQKNEENKKIDNNCIDCKNMTIDQINELINK